MSLGAGKMCIYIDSAGVAKGGNSEDEELELDSDLKRWMRDVAREVKDFRSHILYEPIYGQGQEGHQERISHSGKI